MTSRYGDARDPIRKIVGDEIADQCKPLWGLDEEKELNGVWRDTGVKNMWSMMGMCYNTRAGPMVY